MPKLGLAIANRFVSQRDNLNRAVTLTALKSGGELLTTFRLVAFPRRWSHNVLRMQMCSLSAVSFT
jgi:hypothetical protein